MQKYKKQKKLLSFNNYKILKSKEVGYLGAILHLAPFNLSGFVKINYQKIII
jgi:hypothetical protein